MGIWIIFTKFVKTLDEYYGERYGLQYTEMCIICNDVFGLTSERTIYEFVIIGITGYQIQSIIRVFSQHILRMNYGLQEKVCC